MSEVKQNNNLPGVVTPSSLAYYYRQFSNDWKYITPFNSWGKKAKRYALVALPFLSLYRPFGRAISFCMNTTREMSCVFQTQKAIDRGDGRMISIALLQTSIATAALAGTVFGNVYGMAITSGHDVLINAHELLQQLSNEQYSEALTSLMHLTNNSLYLAFLLNGSLEIIVLSLLAQVVIEAYQSQDEFRKDHFLEGFAHIAMAAIRGSQLRPQLKNMKLKWALTEKLQQSVPATPVAKQSIPATKLIPSSVIATLPPANSDIKKTNGKIRDIFDPTQPFPRGQTKPHSYGYMTFGSDTDFVVNFSEYWNGATIVTIPDPWMQIIIPQGSAKDMARRINDIWDKTAFQQLMYGYDSYFSHDYTRTAVDAPYAQADMQFRYEDGIVHNYVRNSSILNQYVELT